MTPLDYSIYGETEKILSCIEDMGYRVQAFIGMNENFEAAVNACKAEKNIIMNAAALPLAEKMQKNHGIPYWIGPPCGENGIREMKSFLSGTHLETPQICESKKDRVLIIGEQACANSLRKALRADNGYQNITVATFFALFKELAEKEDIRLDSEDSLAALLREGAFDLVIGDPLFELLCDKNQRFIPLPHPAVSSKIHWKDTPSWIGESRFKI